MFTQPEAEVHGDGDLCLFPQRTEKARFIFYGTYVIGRAGRPKQGRAHKLMCAGRAYKFGIILINHLLLLRIIGLEVLRRVN